MPAFTAAAYLDHREDRMRHFDHGRLTYRDRLALNRQENRLSHRIYHYKHNGRVEY